MSETYKIAIDGPAGAGKSTIARRTAGILGFVYVDTGALYRTLAVYFLKNGIDWKDEDATGRACDDISIEIRYDDSGLQRMILNGEDVTGLLRTEEVSEVSSVTSAYPKVREALLGLQRDLAERSNVILDGRDIGTVVLPEAQTKIFLTASPKVRALRRYKELRERGTECDLEEIEKDITERDDRDSHRAVAPLKCAEDAICIDSSDMTIEEVTDAIIEAARKNGLTWK